MKATEARSLKVGDHLTFSCCTQFRSLAVVESVRAEYFGVYVGVVFGDGTYGRYHVEDMEYFSGEGIAP